MDLFLELSPAEDSNESPHCSLDNNIAHILNLLDSPSEQPRSGDTVSDYNDDVPDTQPIRAQILKGVVAYVEARSGNDNRSSAISRELELLGATVEKKLTNDVTHVVFKAGRKVTQERARKRGMHLVSVLWVDSCKQNLRHMSESMFPVVPSETLRTPVFVGRLKKCKSMQPKDFDDDVASSADRGQKRRRRQAHADKWKVLETPGAGLLLGAAHAYVEETQPRSPTDTTPLPFNLTVPDTPPSMREKLDSLRRKRLSLQLTAGMGKPQCGGTAQSSPTQVNEPLQRRLFGIPQYDISPQPCLDTPEIETPKDISRDLIKTNTNSPVGQEAEEEDPLPDRLLGSSTICIPNRRHRLLPLNQEPSTELLQPVYTDQCRRPGQNHFFPEIASQKSKKTKQKCAVKRTERTSNEDTVKLPPRKKGNSTKSGKRKNGSLRKSNTPEEDKLCKRRRKGSGEETERGASVASLRGAVQDVDGARCGNVATTSSHLDRQKSDGSHATGSKEQAKVLDVNDNDVCNTTESGVRLQDVLPCSRVAADSRRPGVKICDMSLQTNSLTNLSKSSGAATVELSSTEETCTTGTRHTNKKCSARLPTIDMQSSASVLTARCRRSVANELRLSNGVNEERTVARRRSVRLQQNDQNKPNCDTVNRARQSVRDCLASTSTDLSASNLSAMNRSTATQLSLTSSVLQNSQFLNLARSSRKSIDEFAIACQRRPSAKKNTPCNNSTVSSVNRSKSVGIHSNKNNSEVVQPNTIHKLGSSSYCRGNSNISGGDVCDTSNWKKIVIAENRKSHEHPSKTLVMTSLHTDEQDMVRSVVKKLGGYRITSSVCETTTHVICGNERRTLNVLLGICRGSWLLSLEWVFKSLECNRWLEEEPYEHSDFFPAAQISRLERLTGSGNYTQDLFSKHSPICITPHTVPSRTDLMKLIRLCAGQVTQCLAKCRVCIGKVPQQPGVISVSEQWVLDSITAHRALPHKMYTLNSAGDSARGDSSPEY